MTDKELRRRRKCVWDVVSDWCFDDDTIKEIARDYGLEDFTGFTDEEVAEWEAYEAKVRADLVEWLNTHDRSDENYSDIWCVTQTKH